MPVRTAPFFCKHTAVVGQNIKTTTASALQFPQSGGSPLLRNVVRVWLRFWQAGLEVACWARFWRWAVSDLGVLLIERLVEGKGL